MQPRAGPRQTLGISQPRKPRTPAGHTPSRAIQCPCGRRDTLPAQNDRADDRVDERKPESAPRISPELVLGPARRRAPGVRAACPPPYPVRHPPGAPGTGSFRARGRQFDLRYLPRPVPPATLATTYAIPRALAVLASGPPDRYCFGLDVEGLLSLLSLRCWSRKKRNTERSGGRPRFTSKFLLLLIFRKCGIALRGPDCRCAATDSQFGPVTDKERER
jgi:hypothetical protein